MELTAQEKSRFWEKVDYEEGSCWIWIGARIPEQYGSFGVGGKQYGAHRISFMIHNPDENIIGLDVHHVCNNPPCVNPSHLLAVSRREHIRDLTPNNPVYQKARQDQCWRGHPLTGDNLHAYTDKNGQAHRQCRKCVAERGSAYRYRRRQLKHQQEKL